MFWWGKSKPKSEVTHVLPDIECPNCNDIGEMYIWGYTKYLHIYWIPMWNIGKKIKYGCDSCDKIVKSKKLFGVSKEQIQAVKSEIRRPPIWHFTGSLILIFIILFVVYAVVSENKRTTAYFNEPEINDIYYINARELGEDYYTSWLLINTDGENMVFAKNLFQPEDISDLSDSLEVSKVHEGDTIIYSQDFLRNILKKDIIYRIERQKE
jgi:hypothetical protein